MNNKNVSTIKNNKITSGNSKYSMKSFGILFIIVAIILIIFTLYTFYKSFNSFKNSLASE